MIPINSFQRVMFELLNWQLNNLLAGGYVNFCRKLLKEKSVILWGEIALATKYDSWMNI